ncbi:YbjN domain-containing protein [Ruminococcus flavefaciens]|uniref:YbjN domain-containing protein n=1 Tax=Ruminococcus flavefaciens TaxID=1265 RepID=UPI000463E52F|nr:YbjN domain-containing protein [Ruminococcus flavefaciens]
MENNNIKTNRVISEFRDLLDKRGITYELNKEDENLIRFRTKLPNYEEIMPFVLIHFNDENGALSLALSKIAVFTKAGPDLYALVNHFNADPGCFGCKMFIDENGEVVVLTNAIVKSGDVIDLIEEYIKINILSIDRYFGQISEIINNSDKD